MKNLHKDPGENFDWDALYLKACSLADIWDEEIRKDREDTSYTLAAE